ncbi:YijD family membrane protein [Aeromonas rivipollensis]|uniref:YijD family membrane protein n=1 Tax=Aeromonas rivipollensis TaxID=948519 RepID=UPI0027D984FF|nr:YijD family membrane protein [uncultured Aeromonas sp.]MDU1143360.1 YijD family membrane protein [Aeromonas hydrophila]
MHESNAIPKMPLLLALLIGICGDAFLSVLTESVVPFSFFPLIALLLAVYQLYQHYRHEPIVGNTPSCILICFFIGVFGHTALLKVQYPELGSNFFSLIAMLLLLAVLSIKLGISLGKKVKE